MKRLILFIAISLSAAQAMAAVPNAVSVDIYPQKIYRELQGEASVGQTDILQISICKGGAPPLPNEEGLCSERGR